jgi:AraC family transcriptional regulator
MPDGGKSRIASQSAARRADSLRAALERKHVEGEPGCARSHRVFDAGGLRISDIVCTSGPKDRPYEEAQGLASIAIVLSGTFSYRGDYGRVLMTPGSLLLGNAGRCFSCGHEHGEGDHCVAFFFAPELLERVAADSGVCRTSFPTHRLPFTRATAPLIARAADALAPAPLSGLHTKRATSAALEEVAVGLASTVLSTHHEARLPKFTSRDGRRVAEVVRHMEGALDESHSLLALSKQAGLSPYHFLRVFRKLTGVSPHQFLLRLRLNAAAHRLRHGSQSVTEIAYAVGFEDLSNFVRTFRAEFGVPPSRYRGG